MDVLDTRDLQERREELQALKDAIDEAETDEEREEAESEFSEDEEKELEELNQMADEIPEWQYGEALINEDNFEEYVEEMLKDCGDLPQNIPWYIVIDWSATADNIKLDYSEIEYQGETYLYRNC